MTLPDYIVRKIEREFAACMPTTEEDVARRLGLRYVMAIPLEGLTNETFSVACDRASLVARRMYHAESCISEVVEKP